MSDWQKVLKDESISTLEELRAYVVERFGEEVIMPERKRQNNHSPI